MKLERGECSPAVEKEESLTHIDLSSSMTRKNNKNKNKRRFSDEQIRSLESIFESESKLEPRLKLQLARELGLHPRQIAIWFQNRRARCKSKQLEQDYSVLKSNYDALASQFESLKKEKQSLLIQLQKLNGKTREQSRLCLMGFDGNSTDGESVNGDTKYESEQKKKKPSQLVEDPDNRKNVNYFGQEEETDLTSIMEPSSSPVNWCSFDSTDLLDQSGSITQWWEIWS